MEPVEPHPKSSVPTISELLLSRGWLDLTCATEGSSYSVLVERAPADASQPYRLSLGELAVASLFARGLSSKEVGAELSLSDTTARGALLRACKKLGVRAAQLPLFWYALESVDPVSLAPAGGGARLRYEVDVGALTPRALTVSERALVLQLLLGRSNAEIARFRDVSTQTIANQLHTLFGKLKASSRGELAASLLCTRGTPAERSQARLPFGHSPKPSGVEDSWGGMFG